MGAVDERGNYAGDDPQEKHHHHGHDSHHHRGHDGHHHGHDSHHHDQPISQEEAVRSLLMLGQVALSAHDYESAVEAFASVLKLEQNETALYSLGSLYARGLAVRQDFVEAARLFHQAELLGNGQAAKLCGKCLFDYMCADLDSKTPADLYAAMAVFVSMVYPDAGDQKAEVNNGLLAVAGTLLNKGAHAEAAKVYRAAAEFGDDGYAQYCLAGLYGTGSGLQENDLAALYWLDRAVDNGAAEMALADRDDMLETYRKELSSAEFHLMTVMLADWCNRGTPDVPIDPDKAARWREVV